LNHEGHEEKPTNHVEHEDLILVPFVIWVVGTFFFVLFVLPLFVPFVVVFFPVVC